MTQTTKVTKKKETLPALDFGLPDDYSLNISSDDIKIPSIILLQKMTDLVELEDRNWKAGQFYDMGTDEIINGNFKALILNYYVTARLLGERDAQTGRAETLRFSGDGVHWDDTNEIIKSAEFKWNEDGNYTKKSYHYLILRYGCDMPTMLTFKGASAKMAKTLNMHLTRMKPAWRNYFVISSSQEENQGNKYYIVKGNPKPKDVVDQITANMCLEFWKMSQAQRISSYEMMENTDTEEDTPAY